MTLVKHISKLCPGGVKQNVNLSEVSRWKIGGCADLVVYPASLKELQAVREFVNKEKLSSVVVGDTSNLLFADEGLHAICICINKRMSALKFFDYNVEAEAGIWVPDLARKVQKAGLSGIEHVCGIPGTLGGLICMNGGSQRKGIGSSVINVLAVSPNGEIVSFDHEACRFSYRKSAFQGNDAVVALVNMSFSPGLGRSKIRREMLSILGSRRLKFPRKEPSCGSVFKSNPDMYDKIGPPGAVIERLGYKNFRIGGAVVSPLHGNFFINAGGARSVDMLRLIRMVSNGVWAATGYRLETEVRYVTPEGAVVSADSEFLTNEE